MLNAVVILLCIYILIRFKASTGDKKESMYTKIFGVVFILISMRIYTLNFIQFWLFLILITIGVCCFRLKYVEGYIEEDR